MADDTIDWSWVPLHCAAWKGHADVAANHPVQFPDPYVGSGAGGLLFLAGDSQAATPSRRTALHPNIFSDILSDIGYKPTTTL
jgi:hypothetical protein